MKKDSDIVKFKKIIKNQSPAGIRVNEWEKLIIEEKRYDNGDIDLKIPIAKVLFCFTRFGRLKGVVNYKQ